MSDHYQYRITVRGQAGAITDTDPAAQWQRIALVEDERGIDAVLERRFVTDPSHLESLTDRTGWRTVGVRAIGPWEVQAQFEAGPHPYRGGR